MILKSEAKRLAELEAIVDHGLQTFVDVGNALMEIRDGRLYRATHETFDAYTRERWAWSRSMALDYIKAAEIAENVRPGAHLPGIKHALALAPLTPDQQREVAPAIVSLTKRQAQEVVRRYRENGVALGEVARIAAETLASDMYLKLTAAVRQVLGVALVRPADAIAGVAPEELAASREAITNARDFLSAVLKEIG